MRTKGRSGSVTVAEVLPDEVRAYREDNGQDDQQEGLEDDDPDRQRAQLQQANDSGQGQQEIPEHRDSFHVMESGV
jgi:hypothetical protein